MMMVVEVELEILGLLIDKILSIPLAVSTLSYRLYMLINTQYKHKFDYTTIYLTSQINNII